MITLDLAELELQLIDLLIGQGLPVQEIRLIGLLGEGSRASAYSVMVDGIYHVLKVYDSSDSLRAEIKNLRRMIPKDQFLFWWQEKVDGHKINLAIFEVPEGQELNSNLLTPDRANQIAEKLLELHRIKYRQRVSFSSLKETFERQKEPYLKQIKAMGRSVKEHQEFLDQLDAYLEKNQELFRDHKVRIHGDLWWPNIIVAPNDVYLIDWESIRRGDPAEDIAKLRIVTYWPRNESNPTYFWRSADHLDRLAQLMQTIATTYQQANGNNNLVEKLRFYLPHLCIYELAQRYINGRHEGPASLLKNMFLADEAVRLFQDPMAPPPDLKSHGYWEHIQPSP